MSRRKGVTIAVSAPLSARNFGEVAENGPLDDAVDVANHILENKAERDPILDDVQAVFGSPAGERVMDWIVRHTLCQQVRLLTTASMSREAAQDFALYREGQNALALALINLINRANEDPPISRTDALS